MLTMLLCKGAGFNSDTNIVKFLFPDGEVRELEQMTKAEVAEELLNTVHAFAQIVNSITRSKGVEISFCRPQDVKMKDFCKICCNLKVVPL